MKNMKPIVVWLVPPGPNPWKIIVILEELQLPYVIESFKFDNVKTPPWINGHVPVIIDPNTNLTLWESAAIIQYLEEVYDTENRLTCDSMQERHHLYQSLHFQMCGGGPYFGQVGWFKILNPERTPSVIERYTDEVKRVLGVLDTFLEGKTWLVGDRCTFADLAFLPWNCPLDILLSTPEGKDPLAPWPNVQRWHRQMEYRPSWKRSMELRDKVVDAQGLNTMGMSKAILNIQEYKDFLARTALQQGR
ncbi:hypothetical protein N7492_008134 [Penicillium capsulatum]|uniref:glutathione transferase n=1 Tax=Penicillium capsulatum TaxID=69766 RepID=A0A9W9HSY1_9EURO|nr:hypothetical protein N7492_008134 [Penicillium capsulatum]KAJ6105545.1 hypothetical protein N7512_009062 [Penicillium capsulatum]